MNKTQQDIVQVRNPEIMSNDKMVELFGNNYRGVVVYNFDTMQWNTKMYNGTKLRNWGTPFLDEAKHVFELATFKDLDVVACAMMSVNNQMFPGWGQKVNKPVFAPGAQNMVGTLVCRDGFTGRIMPVPDDWVGIDTYKTNDELARYVIERFALSVARRTDFRDVLLKSYGRMK